MKQNISNIQKKKKNEKKKGNVIKNVPYFSTNGTIPIDNFFNIKKNDNTSLKSLFGNHSTNNEEDNNTTNNNGSLNNNSDEKNNNLNNFNDNEENNLNENINNNNNDNYNDSVNNLKTLNNNNFDDKNLNDNNNNLNKKIEKNNNIQKNNENKSNGNNLLVEQTFSFDKEKYKTIASKTYFLTEYMLKKILIIIGCNYSKIKNYFSQNNILDYVDMEKINIKEFLIKFLLHFKIKLIYIPKNIILKDNTQNYTDITLFTGFNESKSSFLQYIPTDQIQSELFWNKLTNIIKDYTSNFDGGKSLYIKTESDYRNYVKTVETICLILNYHIIRLDETEATKYLKLNKIYEATQSRKLPFIPDSINNKISLIKLMNENFNIKWKEIIEENIESLVTLYHRKENDDSGLSSESDNKSSNNNVPETLGKQLFKLIYRNVTKYCNEQKNLILISDSFSCDDDRQYFLNILDKIPKIKIPLIILSDNIDYVSTLGDNLTSDLRFETINDDDNSIGIYIYYISVILFFHIFCFEELNSKFNSLEDFVDKLIEKLSRYNIDENNKKQLIAISEFLIYKHNFDLESIFYEIHRILKKFKYIPRIRNFHSKLSKFWELLISKDKNEKKPILIDELVEKTEMFSFYDYLVNQKDLMAEKEFQNNVYYKRKKKIIDDFEEVNLESQKINQILKDEIFYENNYCQIFISNFIKTINKRDKKKLTNYFSIFITNKNLHYYISYIMKNEDLGFNKFRESHLINDIWFFDKSFLNSFPNLPKIEKAVYE